MIRPVLQAAARIGLPVHLVSPLPLPLGELGDSVARVVAPRHKRVTDQWPDPHGPDPVVFGNVPRVGP